MEEITKRKRLRDHKSCLKKRIDGIMIGSAKYSIYKCITALTSSHCQFITAFVITQKVVSRCERCPGKHSFKNIKTF